MEQKLFHLHALSALHVGTGQGVGVVDLPIARARATNLPLVPGSAIKGVLRDELGAKLNETLTNTLFGPASTADSAHAGALAVGDAHLLLLPVRSYSGVVAFATCPFILQRYARDLAVSAPSLPPVGAETAALPKDSALLAGDKVLLEDLDLKAMKGELGTEKWAELIADALYPGKDADAWRKEFTKHFAILPDGVFAFLADTATEIRARVRIDDATRTVDDGALWYEENLPAESVLWGVIGVSRSRNKGHEATAPELAKQLPCGEITLQIGGKHTVGRGLCRFLLA
ncbi:type III-B CRISPR module RAMP protein Cmr4 [Zoogloea sp.]|uniref:type III-B CRISPR module RAMP protein Cmr4 n=1 Tax=Zoogloea sp. TaxID=49181 RepID=UPI0035B1043B